MEYSLVLNFQTVIYTLRVSSRAKRVRVAVYPQSLLILTIPAHLSRGEGEAFMRSKSSWILNALERVKNAPVVPTRKNTRREYLDTKERARIFVHNKLKQYNQFYNFSYNGVRIKNQKTLWGSCSKNNNLNFNYKLVLLSERLAEYIVVHELCHLKEFNHSERFWKLVALTIPEYKEIRKELRKQGVAMQ